MRRLWKNSKGQSLVEFALVLTLMLTLLLGTIDLGFMFFNQYGLSSIAKDAARAASVGAKDDEIRAIVGRDAEMVFKPDGDPTGTNDITVKGTDGSEINVHIQ